MASFWLLKLALKCILHFAWPLVALGYPLCASVQAIETDSYKETRDLMSYWILLSLIYLFEYAFLRLLQWFLFWPYIKLMIISWLIVPDFGRASYVYNNFIHSYVSINPQAAICWLNNWRKFFVKKDKFLLQAERYAKQSGTEALEKLIASKKSTTYKPDAEVTNAVKAIDNKDMLQSTTYKPDAEVTNAVRAIDNKEMQQINGKKLQTEPQDIKDSEVIEKKEIPAGKKDIAVMPNLKPSQKNTSAAMVKTDGAAGEELPGRYTSKKVQKEWTCDLCQVTTTSEETLNSHLHGRKHTATLEALKGEVKQTIINQLKEEVKQTIINQLNSKNKKLGNIVNNGLKEKEVKKHKVQEVQKNPCQPVGMNHTKLRCEICNVTCPGRIDMKSHLKGRKHLANIQNLNLKPPTK